MMLVTPALEQEPARHKLHVFLMNHDTSVNDPASVFVYPTPPILFGHVQAKLKEMLLHSHRASVCVLRPRSKDKSRQHPLRSACVPSSR